MILKEFKIGHFTFDYKFSCHIAPAGQIVVLKNDGKRHLSQCRWGVFPSWTDDPKTGYKMINAGADTVSEKPAFKDAFMFLRCLVVADGFFEWRQQGKIKKTVYMHLRSQGLFGFSRLYHIWKSRAGEQVCTCTIITTEANELLRPIHVRMPAIIPKDKENIWLNPDNPETECLKSLLIPYPSGEVEFCDVSSFVNKPDNDSPEVIDPVMNDLRWFS